jgi:hypothetical protein
MKSGTAACYYRLNDELPHLVIPRSSPTVFLEITNGPFVRGENSYSPAWADSFDADKFRMEYYGF